MIGPYPLDPNGRWEQWKLKRARKLPQVRATDLMLKIAAVEEQALNLRIELLNSRLRAAQATAAQANTDAAALYDHYQEAVDIIALYQGSLRTLRAPDPHEARVRMVVTDFLKQYKDRYE